MKTNTFLLSVLIVLVSALLYVLVNGNTMTPETPRQEVVYVNDWYPWRYGAYPLWYGGGGGGYSGGYWGGHHGGGGGHHGGGGGHH